MKKHLFIALALCFALAAQAYVEASCPSFPGIMYPSMTYNKGCTPWDLEFNNGGAMSGNTDGAYFQWYRYVEGQPKSTATPCTWQTDHTTCAGFKPRTDEDNTRYVYYCKVTTTLCPEGVESGTFLVAIGSPSDPCPTFTGTTFTIQSGSGSYSSGQTVTLVAYTNAYGGEHIYTWYHNGEPLDTTDTRYTFTWDFNNPKLIMTNVQPEDGGTYSISMQDGTECFLYTNPVRVLVDNPNCGPVPNLTVSKAAICEGEAAVTAVSNNTLAAGEVGSIEYMLKPDGSNPTTTAPGPWSTDMPGLYQFKYVVTNPNSPSCFRESKVVSIRVYGGGGTPTITPDATLIKCTQQLHFTCSAPESGETAKITWTNDQGQSGDIYPNTYPNFAHTCYNPGTYTYTYTLTNPQAGCTRTATCEVVWYQCEWGAPYWSKWYQDNSHHPLGTAFDLRATQPSVHGMTSVLTYSLDGGAPVTIPDATQPFTPTVPGTYVFTYAFVHSDPRVTDCYTAITRTLIVDPCGTTAELSTNKTTLKVGESATLTYPAPDAGETAKLSYTKDGGSAQTMTGKTFTPTAPGTYVLTYSITTSCGTTTASVTINVYDCGPDATVTASRTTIRPDDPITITVSSPGADETATLTVSYNGGAPQTIAAGTWSAHNEGTYVFTYTITHAYIDCTRSAQTTVTIKDCSAVTLSADKSVLKLGEAVSLSASRAPDANETATLTYTLNGGAPQPLTPSSGTPYPSPFTYTPSTVGTYVVTYNIHNNLLGCDASSEVTFSVYDCGPEASVTASRTAIRPDDPITITVSSPGADETATLTVSYNGGAPQTIAAGTWSAHDEGTYTFTYTITHPYIECTRSASVVVGISDCGTAVMLSADKSVLKLGEAVRLSASRAPDANESPTLTISVNGGAPQTIDPPTLPMSYTPTAVGSYSVIYKLYNSVLGCETSSEVTFSVYDCGPAITLEADQSILRLGESVNLMLSAAGAEETATLTYSINGGAPTSLPIGDGWGGAFTPQGVGEYVFTYTVSHPYISCTRTASVTVKVYDCGTPASIAADKTVLALGEPLHLTLSALLPEETATLTIDLGGQTIAQLSNDQINDQMVNDQMVNVGTYVFTYTVSHTLIECETSAQLTIKVYDCGPEATIALSQEEVKLLRSVTITLSEPGADETATLTYTLNGGTPNPLTPYPSPLTFTPTELGTYVFTYTITHPYIECTRSATATMQVVEAELVFDDNNGTHVWSDPKNWWPAYNRLPNDADSAIIRRNCNVDTDRAVSYDLTFDGGTIAIQPKGALVVIHRLLQVASNSIAVLTDATGNGALVLGQENTNIPAAVQFYSSAANMGELYPKWQYMGSPVREPQKIAASYPKATVYEWTNTPNKQVGGNWQRVDSLAGAVQPFTGYCLTQSAPATYPLSGTLNDPVAKAVAIPYNDQGTYPGFAFVANSWVAPIDIASLEPSDFGAADATVYIMNAGTYAEALRQQSQAAAGTGAAAGQYNTIPVHAASYLPGALTVIPSMQGFFVHTKAATTLTLDYDKAVYTPAKTKVSTTPTRAPQQIINHKSETLNVESMIRLRVSGYGSEDEVCLIESPEFSYAFENGWDGRKVRSERSDISLAVSSPEGALAVAALPQIVGTEILFDGGNHKRYTITFETLNPKFATLTPLFLLDKETNDYTELTEGATYTFKCGAATRRFLITTLDDPTNDPMENDQKLNAVKFLYNGILYIRLGDRLYNGVGELISTTPENPISIK